MQHRFLRAIAASCVFGGWLWLGAPVVAQHANQPSLSVVTFEGTDAPRDARDAMADELAARLVDTGHFRVLHREWLPHESDEVPALDVLRAAALSVNVDYLVLGTIRQSTRVPPPQSSVMASRGFGPALGRSDPAAAGGATSARATADDGRRQRSRRRRDDRGRRSHRDRTARLFFERGIARSVPPARRRPSGDARGRDRDNGREAEGAVNAPHQRLAQDRSRSRGDSRLVDAAEALMIRIALSFEDRALCDGRVGAGRDARDRPGWRRPGRPATMTVADFDTDRTGWMPPPRWAPRSPRC